MHLLVGDTVFHNFELKISSNGAIFLFGDDKENINNELDKDTSELMISIVQYFDGRYRQFAAIHAEDRLLNNDCLIIRGFMKIREMSTFDLLHNYLKQVQYETTTGNYYNVYLNEYKDKESSIPYLLLAISGIVSTGKEFHYSVKGDGLEVLRLQTEKPN